MEFENLLWEQDGRVLTLTLNRPEKLNSISVGLRRDLDAALDAVDEDDSIACIVLRGAGRAFCAGYDIAPSANTEGLYNRASIFTDRERMRRSVDGWLRMWSFRKPIIAQVHGYCLAGGGEMIGACDLVFCADDARFGHPPARAMGIPPTLGMWPAKIGMLKSKELLYTGDMIDGKEAERIGMVNKSLPLEELEPFVKEFARRVALVPIDALSIHKHTVNRWFEIQGLRTAAYEGAEFDAIYHELPEAKEFAKIATEKGLKAALEWRDGPFR